MVCEKAHAAGQMPALRLAVLEQAAHKKALAYQA
jgi:hypothetical protein